jgi:hypothetical protein
MSRYRGSVFRNFRLYGRVKELEREKQELLVMHKEALNNLIATAPAEKETYREVMKLYSNLIAENAELKRRTTTRNDTTKDISQSFAGQSPVKK